VTKEHAGRLPGDAELASASASVQVRNHAAFIWSVADLLRGDYKRSEYGKMILPLTVLRRLDGVLAPT
jgi:type I restriction-modification system DNA methylase subunit